MLIFQYVGVKPKQMKSNSNLIAITVLSVGLPIVTLAASCDCVGITNKTTQNVNGVCTDKEYFYGGVAANIFTTGGSPNTGIGRNGNLVQNVQEQSTPCGGGVRTDTNVGTKTLKTCTTGSCT
jgi:hypothetical protein